MRAVIVACGDDQRNACGADAVVHFLHMLVIARRKSCGRTEAHIDDVDFQFDAVFQSGENIHLLRPAQRSAVCIVGKDLADNKLRLRRNAAEVHLLVVLVEDGFSVLVDDIVYGRAGNDTGNVRAVRGVRRVYIRILIRVIVCERNFGIVIHVVCRYIGIKTLHAGIDAVEYPFRHHFLGQARLLGFDLEDLVAGIDTGIEYCRDHAFAVIVGDLLVYLINARTPHVGIVGYLFVLRGIVIFGNIDRRNTLHRCDLFRIFDIGTDSNGIGEHRITVFQLVRDSRSSQIIEKICLLVLQAALDALSSAGFSEFAQIFVPAAVGKAFAIQRNDKPLFPAYFGRNIGQGLIEGGRRVGKGKRIVLCDAESSVVGAG